ncbi:MAG: hypothetical protein IPK33_11700 [Gemmatimonadetes bacterium]|nr:hypothetical protein [Gemmatimonadota bacterium]
MRRKYASSARRRGRRDEPFDGVHFATTVRLKVAVRLGASLPVAFTVTSFTPVVAEAPAVMVMLSWSVEVELTLAPTSPRRGARRR